MSSATFSIRLVSDNAALPEGVRVSQIKSNIGSYISGHQLFDMIKSPEATCRIDWQQGALAVWDNRVVQHRAVKDYTPGTRRVLYRCTMTA